MTGAEHYNTARHHLEQAEQSYTEDDHPAATHHREVALAHAQLAGVMLGVQVNWHNMGPDSRAAWQRAMTSV